MSAVMIPTPWCSSANFVAFCPTCETQILDVERHFSLHLLWSGAVLQSSQEVVKRTPSSRSQCERLLVVHDTIRGSVPLRCQLDRSHFGKHVASNGSVSVSWTFASQAAA